MLLHSLTMAKILFTELYSEYIQRYKEIQHESRNLIFPLERKA